ncbi:hypothetical protein ACET3X_000375 [Alternaria dauci]|uniref:Trichoplein multi-domain protein n=1 Tax=Alternaria dauci TaxID=48095 RepID=A0ABR3UUD2_9PLEO
MCRIEERVEYNPDGRPMTSSRIRLCEKARDRKPCRDAVVIPYRYNSKRGSTGRDNTPSPIDPPTPTGSGTYLVETRRPSGSGSRPSTQDGQRPISTEIIIGFGSKKDKTKKYPSISVSTKPFDRSSLGSRGSHEAAIESIGSDASYPVRTGFPEAPLPPTATFDHPNNYLATPTLSYGYRPSHVPSASSSQTPSLYADDDPPARQRSTRYPAVVVHNPPPATPSSPSQRPAATSSGSYRTSKIVPRDSYRDPLDNDVFADNSSYSGSGMPEANRRPKNSDERPRQSKSGRRQEESERQTAEEAAKAERENERHVRFELGRAESRAKERAENHLAEKEKDRAAAREESRRLKEEERRLKEEERLRQEEKDLEKAARDRKKDRSRPPATDYSIKRPSATRRLSSTMTPAQLADQQRLIEAEKAQMRSERQIAEAREREEQLAASLKSQQEKPGYWDPRGGDRSLSSRRESMNRHDSVTSRPADLTRTPSKRRTSISQSNPPALDAQAPTETYRPSSSRKRAPPPLSFPKNFNQDYATRPSSSRRPSFGGQDNPFAASSSIVSPSVTSQDPWDLRNVESALPTPRVQTDGRYGTAQSHGYVDPFATDSDSPSGDYIQPAYASRTGLSRKGSKRKH